MPMPAPITTDQIHKAARKLSLLRPSYAALLAFYEGVFIRQEEAKGEIDMDPIRLSPETVAERRQKALSLVEVSGLAYDENAAARLLDQICGLAAAHATDLKSSATAVSEAITRGDFDPRELFKALLRGDDAFFRDTATRIEADARSLAFLAYNSMQPSIEMGAAQLAVYLDPDAIWRKRYCPVCGSAPALAVLGEEGRRVVSCSFCRHPWQAPRLFCVFCENTKTEALHYLFAAEEDDLRIDVCDLCRHYIKTVDGRKISRPLFPPLEQVASLHLDMIAAEKGFRSGTVPTLDVQGV